MATRQHDLRVWADETLRQTGGKGPSWERLITTMHELASAEDHDRSTGARALEKMADLDALYARAPKHSVFLAVDRLNNAKRAVARAQGAEERAQKALDHELWLWEQFRD
jgi:hypothetical protein